MQKLVKTTFVNIAWRNISWWSVLFKIYFPEKSFCLAYKQKEAKPILYKVFAVNIVTARSDLCPIRVQWLQAVFMLFLVF